MEVLRCVVALKMETERDLQARGKPWTGFPGMGCKLPFLRHVSG